MDNLITKITIFVILIGLISSSVCAWSLTGFIKSIYTPKQTTTQIKQVTPTKQMIDYQVYSDLLQKYNKLVDECNSQAKSGYNTMDELSQALSKQDDKWSKYLWDINNFPFAPSSCSNPSNAFTFCKSGCTYQYYCNTISMNPLFDCNAKITLVECNRGYNLGDIILFKNKNKEMKDKYNYQYLIHQIVGKEENAFFTKGFNNNGIDDSLVYKEDIKGKVIKIEY